MFFEVVSILFVVYALGKELGRYGQERVLQALDQWNPSALTCEVVEARGVVRQKHVADVKPGERVRVHPGAMIPVDGFVCSGESFVHEASMSGEAFAASRRAGDHVLAGTHVVDSTLVIEADDRWNHALHRSHFECSAGSSFTAGRIATDRQSHHAVVCAICGATALLTFGLQSLRHGWMEGLFDAMAVLLVACPCALGFATPVAIWTAMRRLNVFGMVVTSGKRSRHGFNKLCGLR